MKLIEFSYKDINWEIRNLEFSSASLIVGKNAAGKSRTLKQLSNLFRIIKQSSSSFSAGASYCVTLESDNDIYVYDFEIDEGNSIREELRVNGEVFLKREPLGEAFLLNVLDNSLQQISPPANKLVIHVNRDTKKHPFLENIAEWAEQSFSFRFGAITQDFHNYNIEFYSTNNTSSDIIDLFGYLKDNERGDVLQDLSTVGYPVESIKVRLGSPESYFFIREKDVDNVIFEDDISQGMLRCLYLLVFLKYLTSSSKTSTIIVDDLCEGLDYERATKLGKLVYEKCSQSGIQLIATSNDMFLMDVVDIQYWNVLKRNGSTVSAINVKNHPALFENFKFTGLSNFDFFSSDYIAQKLDK